MHVCHLFAINRKGVKFGAHSKKVLFIAAHVFAIWLLYLRFKNLVLKVMGMPPMEFSLEFEALVRSEYKNPVE